MPPRFRLVKNPSRSSWRFWGLYVHRFSLRLAVYSPPQVLQINGRIYQLVLAFLMVGDVANSRAPLLHGRYSMQIRETIDNPSNIGGLFAAAQTREQAQFICWNDCDACRHRIRSMVRLFE